MYKVSCFAYLSTGYLMGNCGSSLKKDPFFFNLPLKINFTLNLAIRMRNVNIIKLKISGQPCLLFLSEIFSVKHRSSSNDINERKVLGTFYLYFLIKLQYKFSVNYITGNNNNFFTQSKIFLQISLFPERLTENKRQKNQLCTRVIRCLDLQFVRRPLISHKYAWVDLIYASCSGKEIKERRSVDAENVNVFGTNG